MRFLMIFFSVFVLFSGDVFASDTTSAEAVKSAGETIVNENAENSAQGKINQEKADTDEVVNVLSEPAPEFKK